MTVAPRLRSILLTAVAVASLLLTDCTEVVATKSLITEADAILPFPDRFELNFGDETKDNQLYVRQGWRYGWIGKSGSIEGYVSAAKLWDGDASDDEFILELSEENQAVHYYFASRDGRRFKIRGFDMHALRSWIEDRPLTEQEKSGDDEVYVDSLLDLRVLHRVARESREEAMTFVFLLEPGVTPTLVLQAK